MPHAERFKRFRQQYICLLPIRGQCIVLYWLRYGLSANVCFYSVRVERFVERASDRLYTYVEPISLYAPLFNQLSGVNGIGPCGANMFKFNSLLQSQLKIV